MSNFVLYSNFRDYATPLDEKCCIIMIKNSCVLWEKKFVLVFLQSCKFGGLLMSQKNGILNSKERHIFASFAERIF